MGTTRALLFAIVCACPAMAIRVPAQHERAATARDKLGKVDFRISCRAAVEPRFNRAVVMLHSFLFAPAREAFASVAEEDPSCGMAYWGIAMTHYLPLLQGFRPTIDQEQGWAAAEKAVSVGAQTRRERDYIAAIELLYEDAGKLDLHSRGLAYEGAMERIHARYPRDREAAVFYALAIWADAPLADSTYANQRKAGAILEKVFAEDPDHPGAAHYLIHCYDNPVLAARALEAARRYAKIAPDSPHALHMPSHIFTRLGLWRESIESNLASAASARRYGAIDDELHADDYLVYAYLQLGQDREAKRILEALPHVERDEPSHSASLYALATIPARYVVERHRWAEAAALTLPGAIFRGGRYAWTEANVPFVRGLSAARLGSVEAARSELERLVSLRETLIRVGDEYWAEQLQIQIDTVRAWVALAEGKSGEALQQMRSAADHEDATDKAAVTAGPVLPARELLGEMLLELKQPAQALAEFEADLRAEPNRFNALSGAAHAAELAGDRAKAKRYYGRFMDNCGQADGDRSEIQNARLFLANQ